MYETISTEPQSGDKCVQEILLARISVNTKCLDWSSAFRVNRNPLYDYYYYFHFFRERFIIYNTILFKTVYLLSRVVQHCYKIISQHIKEQFSSYFCTLFNYNLIFW